MRKLLLLVLAVTASPIAATAQQLPRDTTINVNITRAGRAAPDRMTFFLGIEALAETAPASIERLQTKFKAILDSVKRAAPSAQMDQPVVLGSSPNMQNSYQQSSGPLSLARGAIRVTVSKLTELPALQLAAAGAGATVVGGASYESSTTESVWKAKVAEALESARATAEISATAQGYKLGSLLTVILGGGPQINSFQQPQLNFDTRNYSQVLAPEVVVNATVSATYLLVRR